MTASDAEMDVPETAVEKEEEEAPKEEVAAQRPRRSSRGATKEQNAEEFAAMQRDIFGGDSDESSDEEAEPEDAKKAGPADEAAPKAPVKTRSEPDIVSDAESDEDEDMGAASAGDDDDDDEEAANERLKNIQSQSRKRKRANQSEEGAPQKRARRTGRKKKPKAISDDDAPAPSADSKKKGTGRTKEEVMEAVEGFMRQMMEAQQEDESAIAAGQPALSKLALFQKIHLNILHAELQQTFVERGALSTLRRWIEPLPDKSLPNRMLREEILQLFDKLSLRYLDSAVLQSSGIGRIAQFYAGHPRESPRIKKIAQGLIDKWLRQVYQLNDRYTDMDLQNTRRPSPPVPRKRPAPSAGGPSIKGGSFAKKRKSLTSSADMELKKIGHFIQYPERDNDFRTAPVSTAQAREVAINQKHMAIKNRLGGMRRPKGTSASYKALLRK